MSEWVIKVQGKRKQANSDLVAQAVMALGKQLREDIPSHRERRSCPPHDVGGQIGSEDAACTRR
jgi:hypothetical protein